ncbi:hypothetical protein AVEN_103778-1 [Araneus ventricosus]|uniref:Uncharacterized protein n=1 Tax=Araneus ventricosus TaxID=182803 RepID=A0A4Y2HKG5_ARAVE|nr:hypothetical protein AVEN_103778-1 [Araneus ventricosus]
MATCSSRTPSQNTQRQYSTAFENHISVKLEIDERSGPVHLYRFAKDGSNFQFIHLGGSFTTASKRTTGRCDPRPFLLQPSTSRPPPLSPSPTGGFRFCERGSLPFSRIVFQFYDRMRQMENECHWISKLFDHNSPILIEYSHWRRVFERGAPNGVERCRRECPA